MDEEEWVPPDWVREMNREGGRLPDMGLLRFLFDLTPPGDAFAAAEGARNLGRGEAGAGILGLLGAVPVGGDLLKALRARRLSRLRQASRADDVPLPRLDPAEMAHDIRLAQRMGFNAETERRSWQRLMDEVMAGQAPAPRGRGPLLPAPDAARLGPLDSPTWGMQRGPYLNRE